MDEQKPKHTPGPYYLSAIPESNDVHIISGDQQTVARVLSKESGHENAPEDRVAIQNLALLMKAPRMRDTLEIVLEREHEPMHPLIAECVRELLAEIDLGDHTSVQRQR